MSAEDLLGELESESSDLVRLAEAVSLATLVDPPLLRRARLTLVPEADAGLEADLWHSPLVQTRGPQGIVFAPEVAEELRRRLGSDPRRLEKAWEITQGLHQHLSPAVRLEEEVAWLSVTSEPDASERIDKLLKKALAALVVQERRGLAHWAARALPRLPAGVRVRGTARMLEAGAHLRLGGNAWPLQSDATPDWASWVAPADLQRVPVRVRLMEGAVELDAGATEGNLLRLPQTDPLVVDLLWENPDGGGERSVQVTFRKGKPETVPVPVREVRLRTLLGEVYDLRASGVPGRDLREWILDFSDERARHEPFFGREEDLARLDEHARSGRGIVLVEGPVGTGKTALLARFLKLREDQGSPTPHHFFRRGDPRRESGFWAEKSLAAQIAALDPKLESAAAHQELSEVLAQASRSHRFDSEPLVLVLDALEEERGGGLLRRLFPQEVPDGIVVIASIHPSVWPPSIHELFERFSLSDPEPALPQYWDHHRPESREVLVSLSAGSFGVAAVLRSWFSSDPPGSHEVGEAVPSSFLENLWEDAVATFGEEITETGLGALAAARGPLPESVLEKLLDGESSSSSSKLIQPASELIRQLRFLLLSSGDEDARSWELEQDVVRELVREKLQARIYGIHQDLARSVTGDFSTGNLLPNVRIYGLINSVVHWMDGGKPEEAYRLLMSPAYLVPKCREIGIEAVLADLQEWLGNSSTRQWLNREESRSFLDEASERENPEARVRDLLALLTEEEPRLRKEPEALPGMLYNRLLQQGLHPEAIRNLLGPTTALPALRLKQPLDRDRPLRRGPSRRHRDAIAGCTIAESQGNPVVVSWSADGTLKVWDIVSGDLRTTLVGHRSAVTGCALYSSDRVIASSRNGSLRTWQLSESPFVHALHGHEGEGLGVTVTGDSERAISWSADGTIRVWDLKEGRELLVLRGHEAAVTSCAVTQNGRHVVSGSADATVRIWNLFSGELLRTWRGHAGVIVAVLLGNSNRVISASTDGAVKIWSRGWQIAPDRPGEEARSHVVLKGGPGGLLGCAVSEVGSYLAVWSKDQKIRVWDLTVIPDDLEVVAQIPVLTQPTLLEGHQGAVQGCAFYQGNRLASCSADGTVRIWDVTTGETLSILQGHRRAVRSIALDTKSIRGLRIAERIASGSEDRTLRVWSAEDGSEQAVLDGDNETLFCLGLRDRQQLVTWSRLGDLRLHNLEETSPPGWLGSPSMVVGGTVLTPDDHRLVLWSRNLVDGQARFSVWDIFSPRETASFGGHSSPVLACTVAPDARLISAHLDGTVEIRDLDRDGQVSSLRLGSGAPVADLAISPDGSLLLCATWAGELWLREIVNSWETARLLRGHTDRVHACAFHPFGGTAVSASADRTLRLWFHQEGRAIAVLSGHDDEVTGCAFTPDGSRVISRSLDGTLGIWDARTGALLSRLRGHTDWVNAFALDEDRHILYSCSEDETVRAWDLTTGEPQGIVYGVAPFRSLAATRTGVCAGDEAGNFWVLEHERALQEKPEGSAA